MGKYLKKRCSYKPCDEYFFKYFLKYVVKFSRRQKSQKMMMLGLNKLRRYYRVLIYVPVRFLGTRFEARNCVSD
jgi:hypothetical protein